MTREKDFKRKVRDEARRTGRSYADARRLLLDTRPGGPAMTESQKTTTNNPRFGYSLTLPAGYHEFPADSTHSPWEVARFLRRDHTSHLCLVFRMPGRVGLDAREPALRSKARLEAKGFVDFALSEVELGKRHGTLLTFQRSADNKEPWSAREYFVTAGSLIYCLGLGSGDRSGDAEVFDRIAQSFEVEAG
jgi:hypothetical protein